LRTSTGIKGTYAFLKLNNPFIIFPIFNSDYMPRRGNNVNDGVASVDFF